MEQYPSVLALRPFSWGGSVWNVASLTKVYDIRYSTLKRSGPGGFCLYLGANTTCRIRIQL
jgi:hypothetical protein